MDTTRYITLQNLTGVLFNFFNRHKQVETVEVGNQLDFDAIPSILYPAVHIEPVEATVNGNFISQGFIITIADIMEMSLPDRGVPEIINDAQLIANDFLTHFIETEEDFETSTIVTMNPFEEENTDRVAGVTFRVNIVYNRYVNTCTTDGILDITGVIKFDFETRHLYFTKWFGYPEPKQYLVSFDSGNNYDVLTDFKVSIPDDVEYNKGSIRIKLNNPQSHLPVEIVYDTDIPVKELVIVTAEE